MLCVAFYEGFDEGGFADTWRADNSDDLRGRVEGEAVNLGDVEAFLLDLEGISARVRGWIGMK